jgi:O-antigen ligase
VNSSAASDAPSREIAPIATLTRDRQVAAAAAVAASVLALGAASGGSGRGSWPWAIAAFALLAASTLVLEGVRWIPRHARWFGGALLALAVWSGLSAVWSLDASASLYELERDAVYVAGFVSALGLMRFGGSAAVAAGVALGAAAVAGYSLVDFAAGRGRSVFDWSVPAAPVGYANALAALSVLGAIAAVSLAAAGTTMRTRLAWLSLLAVLGPTIILTKSVGAILAGGVALTIGLAVWAAPSLRRRPRATVACVLVAAALVAGGAVLGQGQLRRNDRMAYWRVAVKDFESHVAVGSGGGTYAEYWSRHPERSYFAPFHAHSLYLETAAELGIVGLALVVAMLALPLASIGGRDPIRLGAACGFLAFALHCAVDWDWDVPVVTTAALFLASVFVAEAARPSGNRHVASGAHLS